MNAFLKANWKRPGAGAVLALIGLVVVLVLVVTFWPRPQKTLYVLPPSVPVDSIRSVPGGREVSAKKRWDSLLTEQP